MAKNMGWGSTQGEPKWITLRKAMLHFPSKVTQDQGSANFSLLPVLFLSFTGTHSFIHVWPIDVFVLQRQRWIVAKNAKPKIFNYLASQVALSGKEPTYQCRRRQETWVQALGQEDLEESVVSQYPCLQNPIEEAGRPWSTGSQRIGHNWRHSACTHTWPLTENVCQPFLWMPGKCHRLVSPQNQGLLPDLASALRPGLRDSIQIGSVDWAKQATGLGGERQVRPTQGAGNCSSLSLWAGWRSGEDATLTEEPSQWRKCQVENHKPRSKAGVLGCPSIPYMSLPADIVTFRSRCMIEAEFGNLVTLWLVSSSF